MKCLWLTSKKWLREQLELKQYLLQIEMPYKSNAQRKAVWASRNEQAEKKKRKRKRKKKK